MPTFPNKTRGPLLLALGLILLVAGMALEHRETAVPGALEPDARETDTQAYAAGDPVSRQGALPKAPLHQALGASTRQELAPLLEEVRSPEQTGLLRVRVLSSRGQPLKDAVVFRAEDVVWRSPPTNAKGETLFQLSGSDVQEIRVVALAHEPQKVTVSEADLQASALGASMVVRLERETLLTLAFHASRETKFNGLTVELRTPNRLMAEGKPGPDVFRVAVGAMSAMASFWGRGDETTTFLLNESREVVLSGIAAGAPLKLTVLDSYQSAILSQDLAALHEGEIRIHDVVLQGAPRNFSLRLRDEAGANVEGAEVVLRFRNGVGGDVSEVEPVFSAETSTWRVFVTDGEGLVSFEGLWALRGRLEVTHPEYAPLRIQEFKIQSGGVHDLTLSVGMPVVLVVGDAAGRYPADAVPSALFAGSDEFEVQDLGEGRFLFERLPVGTLEFRVLVGGCLYTKSHDTRVPKARILIPSHGSIEATLAKPMGKSHYLSLLPVDTSIRPNRAAGVESVKRYDWLHPGDYELCIQRLEGDKGWDWHDVTERQGVRVRAGAEVQIHIDG